MPSGAMLCGCVCVDTWQNEDIAHHNDNNLNQNKTRTQQHQHQHQRGASEGSIERLPDQPARTSTGTRSRIARDVEWSMSQGNEDADVDGEVFIHNERITRMWVGEEWGGMGTQSSARSKSESQKHRATRLEAFLQCLMTNTIRRLLGMLDDKNDAWFVHVHGCVADASVICQQRYFHDCVLNICATHIR